jgi:hypothetical protein
MKARPDCIPCALTQVLSAARRTSDDQWLHTNVLKRAMAELTQCDLSRSPAEVSFDALKAAVKVLGEKDPFAGDKKRYNDLARSLLPDLRRRIAASSDPVGLASRLAVAGNIIDLGILSEADVKREVERALEMKLAIDDTDALRAAARSAKSVLYLLDNAGEIMFDGLLIEQFKRKDVTCLVRSEPVLNDATAEDAEAAGLGELCRVTHPGEAMLGLVLNLATREVRSAFEGADLVVAKGQANFETLCGVEREVFFLLRAKCAAVAEELGVETGAAVLYRHEGTGGG